MTMIPPPSNYTEPPAPEDAYSCPCPRCGYPESRDDGPYQADPFYDAKLGGPPDPRIHLMWCGRCGKPFDAGPAELAACDGCAACQETGTCGSDGCHCD